MSTTAPDSAMTVVIAARNAASTIARCLDALCPQLATADRVIVVDDGSTDETADIAGRFPVRVVRLEASRGPAGARNEGAREASTPLILFLDADTVAAPDAVSVARRVMDDPSLAAAAGSYDDDPDVATLVSQFKNLAHHHFHQRAAGPVGTFFSGCGVIRRHWFDDVGGFDEIRYRHPSVEDVELGVRLCAAGASIRIEPDLQAKHLKRWTLAGLLLTDVTRRAIPWMRLALERGRLPGELNASMDQRLAAVTAVVLAVAIPAAVVRPVFGVVALVALLCAGLVNRSLFTLFHRRGGIRLLVVGFALQQLYYLYSLVGAVAGGVLWLADRGASRPTLAGGRGPEPAEPRAQAPR